MHIDNLPPKLRELALLRRSENTFDWCTSETTIDEMFSWSHTPEGGSFWSDIHYGRFPEEYMEDPLPLIFN